VLNEREENKINYYRFNLGGKNDLKTSVAFTADSSPSKLAPFSTLNFVSLAAKGGSLLLIYSERSV
jgi:hypothetical protein